MFLTFYMQTQKPRQKYNFFLTRANKTAKKMSKCCFFVKKVSKKRRIVSPTLPKNFYPTNGTRWPPK